MDLWLVFVTGLTTGGLTCLAVQGGLLATAMTRQVAVDTPSNSGNQSHRAKNSQNITITGIQLAKNPLPVAYFLGAKLFAYTLLGLLLGLLGSVAQITPNVQAAMQIAAGLFMLATALNMLNIHPMFRYFVIQPPKVFTRLIRDQAKGQEVFAPAVLGFLTVLIPCGTTQAMEVVAISSGNPLTGAAILFVFVLGTMPTFLVLGFLATRVRGTFQQVFAIGTAALILVMGAVSIDAGLNLMGAPFSPSRIVTAIVFPTSNTSEPVAIVNGAQEFTIEARYDGYYPNTLIAKQGQPIRLRLTSNGNYSCTRNFVLPYHDIQEFLPETGEIIVSLPPQPRGDILFSCGMGMFTGTIRVS